MLHIINALAPFPNTYWWCVHKCRPSITECPNGFYALPPLLLSKDNTKYISILSLSLFLSPSLCFGGGSFISHRNMKPAKNSNPVNAILGFEHILEIILGLQLLQFCCCCWKTASLEIIHVFRRFF